jgi:hypothetical protein
MITIIGDINNFILENIVYYDKKEIVEEVVKVEEIVEEEVINENEIINEKEIINEEEVVKVEEVIKNNKPKISMIEDSNLPSLDLTLPEAMIEMMKNPKCLPYKAYIERWTFLKKKQDKRKKLILKDLPLVNDELLPPIDLTLPIAMAKIKENKNCVPFDLYVKRWNELKTLSKHKKRFL